MPPTLLPLKLQPAFQDYLWGGVRLKQQYGKKTPPGWDKIAEAWEVSTHPHGLSLITEGAWAGRSLQEYLRAAGPAALGSRFTTTSLPILVKIIDAMDNLSIQVHPPDDYALKYEHSFGKTEMWYVLDAAPGSFIYYGFKKRISANEFEARIKNETLPDVLKKVRLKKGDVFMIPAGTLHAIGKGLLVLEVQQSSDLTYRIYDYGRRDKDGQLRQLHLEKALDVTYLGPAKRQVRSPIIPLQNRTSIETLVHHQNFIVKRLNLQGRLQLLSLPDTYQVLFAAQGNFTLHYQNQTYPLAYGETIFLPAGLGTYHLEGEGEVIMVTDN